ncbi:type II toxin-antitoxin system RelB/DinJ family antitoxin [Asticcacaulis sp.]|uniref:type II toxin-antitoxin system RelB/DinJ family antitoxin n=1 Tax=Asticcacaulis sp. TaxID=1872648 RepID=UPI002634E516|nr:type II toxin-antitoxin system RelB/DinJ family antitoxin [Asticcacaulis sp.]
MATVPVQTRVESDIKIRAGEVLEKMGLTVSDAVRILLTRIAHDGALPAGLTADTAAYEAWFKAKVHEALNDPRPDMPHEEVEAHFAARRAKAQQANKG